MSLFFYSSVRIPLAVLFSVLILSIVANVSQKNTPGGVVKKTKAFVVKHSVVSIGIVMVCVFGFNEALKMVNNSIVGARISKDFWAGDEFY